MNREQKLQQNKQRVLLWSGLAYCGLYTAWLLVGSKGAALGQSLVGSLAVIFPALTAAAAGMWVVWISNEWNFRRAWLRISIGLMFWAVGDVFKLLFLNSQAQQASYGFYLAGALILWSGLIVFPREPRKNSSRLRMLLDTTLSTAALLTLLYIILVEPQLSRLSSRSALFLYPLFDLMGLLLLVNIILVLDVRKMPAALGWLFSGLLAYTLSDLMYVPLFLEGSYRVGTLTDIGWVLGDVLFLTAAVVHVRGRLWETHFRQGLREFIQSVLPILNVLALGVFTIVEWQFGNGIHQLGMWMTVVLSLGLISRQGIAAGETELQKYANLVNSVAEPIFVCDQNGVLVLTNPALLTTSGYSQSSQLLGKSLKKLVRGPDAVLDFMEAGLEDGWEGELEMVCADGSVIPISLALRPLQPTSDRRLVLAGTAHDLQVQKRQQAELQAAYEQLNADRAELARLNTGLELIVSEKTASLSEAYQRLEKQNRELQELDQLKSDFVSMVSHELRAPLTNINMGIELTLMREKMLSERSSQYLELVKSEIQRLTNYVETILDLSALEAGRMPLYPAPVALSTVVDSMQKQMIHTVGAQRIEWNIPESIPYLLVDERALSSILFHLLDNALKYAPVGKISVQAEFDDKTVQICVMDEGPGLDSNALEHLFDRFYRIKPNDAQTVYGYGLGLYIVKYLLNLMGGDIRGENREGGGACFTFWLPLAFEEGDLNET